MSVRNESPYLTLELKGCVHTTFTWSHFFSLASALSLSDENVRTLFVISSFLLSFGVMKEEAGSSAV